MMGAELALCDPLQGTQGLRLRSRPSALGDRRFPMVIVRLFPRALSLSIALALAVTLLVSLPSQITTQSASAQTTCSNGQVLPLGSTCPNYFGQQCPVGASCSFNGNYNGNYTNGCGTTFN